MSDWGEGERRRNVFSNPRVQLRIILTFAVVTLLYIGTTWYISLHALGATGKAVLALDLSRTQARDVMWILNDRGAALNKQLMVQTFVAFVLFTMIGVLISHHIGGPVRQLCAYLYDVVEGRTPPRRIGFRRGDFFLDLPDVFNAFQVKFGILRRGERPPTDAADAVQGQGAV